MRQYFTDTATGTLTYSGSDSVTVDASFDPSEAETATLDTKWEQFFDTNEFVQFEATVAQPIEQPYFYDGELQTFKKDKQELKTAQAQIDNLPWTRGHPENDRVTSADDIKGFWKNPYWDDGQQATLNIPANDPDSIRFAVQNDNVSVGFSGTLDWTDDSQTAVDAIQRDMAYDHIASVQTGRCSPEDGCQVHTDSDSEHGHVEDTVDINIPSYSEGDVVGHRLFPEFTGQVVHNPDNPEVVMVDPLRETASGWEMTGQTMVAGPADLIEKSEMDQAMIADAVRTTATEEEGMTNDMNPTYSEGDWVQWEWSGGTATGRVKSVHTDGEVSASETTRNPQEEGEPVYKISHWNNGEFGNTKIAYESNVSSASKPENFSDSCGHICSTGPCSCGAHDPFSDVSVNGEDIDLVPPEAAQKAAQQALDARDNEETAVNGMQSHGWSRAEQLASGEELSPSDIVGSSGAMAPWWSRHAEYSISGDSLKEAETDNPWEDNSYTSGKGWGGYSGYQWAIRKGNEIKRARGEEPTYSDSMHSPDGLYVEDGDWYGIAPDENPDGKPKYDLNNCNDVRDAYNLRNNGDYDISTETLITRIKRAADAHDCSSESKPWTDSNTTHNDTMDISEFVDQNDVGVEDVRYIIDSLDIDTAQLVDAPDAPTDFYDGEPTVEDLADDFDAVDLLVDEKENLQEDVDSLREGLRESKRPVFADKAEKLAELTHKWGDSEELMAKFDADDEDERWTVDTLEDKIELVEDIKGEQTTTVDSAADSDSTNTLVADNDGTVSETEISRTQDGKLDLRDMR